MSYQQPGYNPAYQNPYPQGGALPPPPGFNVNQGQGGQFPPPIIPRAHMFNQNVENGDTEQQGDGKYNLQFNEKSIRAAFVRKVFSIIFLMLLGVTILTAIPWFHRPTMQMIRRNNALYFGGYIVFLITYLSLACCKSARRSFPMNVILTAIFTFAIGVMTMVITSRHDIISVLLALIITTFTVLAVVIFSVTTKFDITAHTGYIAIFSFAFIIFSFVAFIFTIFVKVKILLIIYAFIGTILFMVYLCLDIQMLMGGKKIEISPEDYIFAAVEIFLDIIQIFWLILSLIGNSR
ncbi:unnamed protein product [Caenorhabditis bovis]|uniref:Uncharacterized protein n=1 Tax=Caenorhabditis bovis TaxID=2654633 RepID=A0A8S1E6D5_9PELO|nr:unnamed protein product [Caenorhabditis bovis]